MKVGLVIVSAVTVFFSARYITKNYIKKKPRSTSVSKERLMQSRNQTKLSSWMFDTLWDTIFKDSIETSVDLILSSDTYELRAILRFNQREISTRLELLG